MENGNIGRTVAIVAAVIVVLGIVIVGSQYLSSLTRGASADVIDFEEVPDSLDVSKTTYQQMVNLTDEYFSATDLATKNGIMQELQDTLLGLYK